MKICILEAAEDIFTEALTIIIVEKDVERILTDQNYGFHSGSPTTLLLLSLPPTTIFLKAEYRHN